MVRAAAVFAALWLMCLASAAQDNHVRISGSFVGDSTVFIAAPTSPGLYSVMLRRAGTVYTDTVSVGRTFLKIPTGGIRFFSSSSVLGDAWGTIDTSVTYRLPFGDEKREVPYRLGIERGAVTHIFSLAKGDTVYASRKGVIISVTHIERAHAAEAARGGQVLVQHLDGSLAYYRGLEEASVRVRPGQMVFPFTAMGLAGENGKYGRSVLLCIRAPHFNKGKRPGFEYSDIQPSFATAAMEPMPGGRKGWLVTPRVSYEIFIQEMTRDDF